MDDEARRFLEKLSELGGRASNSALRAKLDLEKEIYFAVRSQCLAAGYIGLGAGRGGFVILADTNQPENYLDADRDSDGGEQHTTELSYYNQLQQTIAKDWVRSEGFDSAVTEVTGSRRARGVGRWTVPDIVMIGKTVRQYVPGFEFAVHSIEVKRFEAVDALAVFEALNHRRSAHYSYLLIVGFPEGTLDAAADRIGQITQLCTEHGVGLIHVKRGHEALFDSWSFEVYPVWSDPEYYNLDALIRQYISSEGKDTVAKMVR